MNNTTLDTAVKETVPIAPPGKTGFTNKIADKIPPQVKEIFGKFYANKKIFWPVTIVFGLLFLVIILGLLFGNKGGPVPVKNLPTPTPFIQATSAPCSETDVLCATGNKLNDLDGQIKNLDLQQSRLTPPQINYDISF